MTLPRTPGIWKTASRPVRGHMRQTRPHKWRVSTKNTRFNSHTHACQQLCCLAEMWECWLPLKHTVLIWNPVIWPLFAPEHAALKPLFNNLRTPTVVRPPNSAPPPCSLSFYLIQTSVFLTGFPQLTLDPGASRSP